MKTLATIGIWIALAGFARADSAAILAQEKAGEWQVTVFAPSLPLRAGPVELGVLVQDARTLQPVLDAGVTIQILGTTLRPTRDSSANRILYAARGKIPKGTGTLVVTVQRLGMAAEVRSQVKVETATEPAGAYIFCFSLVPLGITMFFLTLKLHAESPRRNSNCMGSRS